MERAVLHFHLYQGHHDVCGFAVDWHGVVIVEGTWLCWHGLISWPPSNLVHSSVAHAQFSREEGVPSGHSPSGKERVHCSHVLQSVTWLWQVIDNIAFILMHELSPGSAALLNWVSFIPAHPSILALMLG